MADRDPTWLEVEARLGAPLWAAIRAEMARGTKSIIGVVASFSDPHGRYGVPTMMTIVGPRGGAPLLRLETTWTADDRSDAITRYWLPAEMPHGE